MCFVAKLIEIVWFYVVLVVKAEHTPEDRVGRNNIEGDNRNYHGEEVGDIRRVADIKEDKVENELEWVDEAPKQLERAGSRD